jgi:hypothetical protein
MHTSPLRSANESMYATNKTFTDSFLSNVNLDNYVKKKLLPIARQNPKELKESRQVTVKYSPSARNYEKDEILKVELRPFNVA